MPGTPPSSPRFSAPRYADGDTAAFAAQVNAVTDTFDAKGTVYATGTHAARLAATATDGLLWRETDTGLVFLGLGSGWRQLTPSVGATNIAASESTGSTTYTTLGTPDQVAGIVLPANGLIAVWYQASWSSSLSAQGYAAIFVSATQAVVYEGTGSAPALQQAQTPPTGSPTGTLSLASSAIGLVSSTTGGYAGDATTGQIVGADGQGGPAYIFAPAGTYTVSVRYCVGTGGTVTAQNRKLWVQALPFS